MPNRYLRASYVESESVNAVSLQAEVVWTHLLVTVDDWGRAEANVRSLRPKLFPLRLDQIREADLSRLLAECEKAGLVRLYTVDGKTYLEMQKWERGRAERSRFPQPPTDANIGEQVQTSDDNGVQPHLSPIPIPAPAPIPTPSESGRSAPITLRKPTLPEVKLAMAKAGLPETEAQRFIDYHESGGWKIGKKPMVSWQAAVGTWKSNYGQFNGNRNTQRSDRDPNRFIGGPGDDCPDVPFD